MGTMLKHVYRLLPSVTNVETILNKIAKRARNLNLAQPPAAQIMIRTRPFVLPTLPTFCAPHSIFFFLQDVNFNGYL